MNAPKICKIDQLVILKIIQHCNENVPNVVTGCLMGLYNDGVLEITNSFPALHKDDEESECEFLIPINLSAYQYEMMKTFRDVNNDYNSIGWYISNINGSFLQENNISQIYNFQKEIPTSVSIVYEVNRGEEGLSAFTAYRLSPEFMDFFQKHDFSQESKFRIDSTKIFTKVPISIQHSAISKAFLYELQQENPSLLRSSKANISHIDSIIKEIGMLSDCIDNFSSEQNKINNYQRQVNKQLMNQNSYLAKKVFQIFNNNFQQQENASRKAAGETLIEEDLKKHYLFRTIHPPNILPSLLLSHQMNSHGSKIQHDSKNGLSKTFLIEGLY